MADILSDDLLTLTADIVTAHLSFNKVAVADLPALIGDVHAALGKLGAPPAPAPEVRTPAVSVASSVKPDHIVCLEDGAKLKTLKRHLASHHGITPAEYRERWGLPADYPMVAPDYAKRRQSIALEAGLGRRGTGAGADAESMVASSAAPAVADVPEPEVAAPEVAAPAEPAPEPAVPEPAVPEPVIPEVVVKAEPAVEPLSPPAAPAANEAPATGEPPKRRTLRAKFDVSPALAPAAPPVAPDDGSRARTLLCRAIADKTCVSATYNKQHVILAPHIVFTRHDEPFLRGVTLQRDGKRPAALKLGTFRLTGLVDLQPTTKRFVTSPLFERNDPEYEGTTVCII